MTKNFVLRTEKHLIFTFFLQTNLYGSYITLGINFKWFVMAQCATHYDILMFPCDFSFNIISLLWQGLRTQAAASHPEEDFSVEMEVHFINYNYYPSSSFFSLSKYPPSFFPLSLAHLHSSFLLHILRLSKNLLCFKGILKTEGVGINQMQQEDTKWGYGNIRVRFCSSA